MYTDTLSPCRVSADELKFDHDNAVLERQQRTEYLQKRSEVIDLANRFLEGKPVRLDAHGKPYTLSTAAYDVAEHDLYDGALIAVFQNHHIPLRDLLVKIVRHRACEFLYEGESDYLGFEL